MRIDATGVTLADGASMEADLTVLALGAYHRGDHVAGRAVRGTRAGVRGRLQHPGRIFDAIHTAYFASRLI